MRPIATAGFVPILCALFSPLIISCSGEADTQFPSELNVYIWSEYIDPEIVSDFEKQTGVKVNLSLYESSEEMMAKLQHAGGVSQYDVVVVSNMMVPLMARLGLIQPLDHGQIPNRKNLAPSFLNPGYDPGNRYSLAYQWGTVGLIYNRARHPHLTPSWAVLFDPDKQAGPFLLIDEMRDQLGIALIYLGYSANSVDADQVRRAGERVLAAKKSKYSEGFEGGVGGKNRVAAGSVDMAVVWNGDALRAIEEDTEGNLSYVVPQEGSIVWADVMAIPAQAPHLPAAHRFVNYILDAEAGARLSAYTRYATPNRASRAFIDRETLDNPALYPPPDILDKLEYQQDVGEHARLYDEVWTAVKAR